MKSKILFWYSTP